MKVSSNTDSFAASNFIIPPQNTPNAAQAIVDELADTEKNSITDFTDCQVGIKSF